MSTGSEQDAQPLQALHRRLLLENYLAAACLVVCAMVAVPQWHVAAVIVPSVALGGLCLIIGWERRPPAPLLVAGMALGAATLSWDVMAAGAPGGSLGLALSGGVWAVWLPARQVPAAVALTCVIALVSCCVLLAPNPNAWRSAWTLSAMAMMAVVAVFYTRRHWQLICELERVKDSERDLAVLRERHRIAADLHDIQGHTLHVIKLKAALAHKVAETDPQRTRVELAAISALVARTLEEGRALARATHTLGFEAELANAVALLEAAGIEVALVPDAVPRPGALGAGQYRGELAFVLREGTTNILRHSRARRVSFAVGPSHLRMANDGAGDAGPPQGQAPVPQSELGGLAILHNRVREAGGQLRVLRGAGSFILEASFAGGAKADGPA